MAKPTRVMCPFCRQSVRWFYGTGTFGRHRGLTGQPCAARLYRAVDRGSIFSASDPRFNRLVRRNKEVARDA